VQRTDDLPQDVESLQRLVRSQQAALRSRQLEIEQLRLQLAQLRRAHFGRSSEQLDEKIAQLELTLEELETTEALTIPVVVSVPRDKPVRRPLPAHLPREAIVYEPRDSCSCPDCGGAMRALGEDVSEMLEYIPSRFKVIRHVRPKFSCSQCQKIVQAPAPSRPIERGLAGPALLAHVLVSKYCDHLPLYRQSQIYAREGVDLDRSTLADWVGASSALLEPLVDSIGRYVLSAEKLHADDTPVPVLSPGNGKTKTGRLWSYVRDDRPAGSDLPAAVWFRYSPDRKGERPREHLKSFSGILQADAYAGFDRLYQEGRIQEAACWAHARRKFFDIQAASDSPIARESLERVVR
jgi:transposase